MLVLIIKFQVYLEIISVRKMTGEMAGNLCLVPVHCVRYSAVAAGHETVLLFHVIGRPLLVKHVSGWATEDLTALWKVCSIGLLYVFDGASSRPVVIFKHCPFCKRVQIHRLPNRRHADGCRTAARCCPTLEKVKRARWRDVSARWR